MARANTKTDEQLKDDILRAHTFAVRKERRNLKACLGDLLYLILRHELVRYVVEQIQDADNPESAYKVALDKIIDGDIIDLEVTDTVLWEFVHSNSELADMFWSHCLPLNAEALDLPRSYHKAKKMC